MKRKIFITASLLSATILISFAMPKPKYQSPDIIGKLNVPTRLRDWKSKDMSKTLKLEEDDRYNFVSDVFARLYQTPYREKVLFLLVDAGNFHHPKVCYGSSGFQIKEMDDTLFSLPGKKLQAKTLFARKNEKEGTLIIYWMVINQKQVNWSEQKIQQLWYQLFNKEKIGVMGRLDIPVEGDNTKLGIQVGQKFIREISRSLSKEDAAYIFGK